MIHEKNLTLSKIKPPLDLHEIGNLYNIYNKNFMKTKNKFWYDRYKHHRNILNCLITKNEKYHLREFLKKHQGTQKKCEPR